MNLIEKAKTFAITAHKNQKYGGLPYLVHLEDVDNILQEFGHHSVIIRTAGWLHDTIEDTDTTIEQLKEQFPNYVCDIVEAVTNESGTNRKERNAKTYPKIAKYPCAIVVKLADRIANVRRSLSEDQGKLQMYKKEYPDFHESLYGNYTCDFPLEEMWEELDRLMGLTFKLSEKRCWNGWPRISF